LDDFNVALVDQTKKFPKVLAVGQQAINLSETMGGDLELVWPVQRGLLVDFLVAEDAIKLHLKAIFGNWFRWVKPVVLISISRHSGQISRRAMQECWESAGASKIYLTEQPICAALGLGHAWGDQAVRMVAVVGAGVTEVSLFNRETFRFNTLPIAGNDMNAAIVTAVRRKKGQVISPIEAERLKLDPGEDAELVSEAVAPIIDLACETIVELQEVHLPQIPEAIRPTVCHLVGGVARMPEFVAALNKKTHLPIVVPNEPELVVSRGFKPTKSYI